MTGFNKHIIIVGSARSGTSWLAETIAKQHRYRSLFEPEHEFNTSKGHLLCDRLVTQKEDFEAGHAYLKKVFANRVDNNWIAQNSNRKWKRHLWPLIPKKFIIKFVRCNLAAHYMNQIFGIPVVHIIRNPYEVLHSQQRVNFPWLYDLRRFANDKKLVAVLQKEFNFQFKPLENYTEIEKLALRWSIENVVPVTIQQTENLNYRIIKHEDLRNNLELFLELCKDFNLKPLPNIAEEYKKPSSKTHPKSVIRDEEAVFKKFSSEELSAINRILDTFAVTMYPRQTF
ncbi:MAG: sulfotransferase family protein [Flavobacteriaceae bacterium]|nr:sulfotransferase family protein [Flavobacteriaceae bacterium]|tara:strand:+ start:50 stop:904 length:855 start_codon:yes stop_codon:yes gene_type:complete